MKIPEVKSCLNCGAELNGKFCSACGQEDYPKNISVKMLFSDFVDDYFTLDSKLFKSFLPLLFKPGFLTLEYFKGKRDGYVKPFRIYIITSLIFFFMAFLNQGDYVVGDGDGVEVADTPELSDSLQTEIDFDNEDVIAFNFDTDSLGVDSTSIFEMFIEERTNRLSELSEEEINQHMTNFFRSNIPRASFFLLPVFAFILKMFFWRQRKFYLEHLVTSLHFQSFLYIILAIVTLVSIAGKGIGTGEIDLDWLQLVLIVVIIPYGIISMKKIYEQGYGKIILKMTGVTLLSLTVLVIALSLVLILALVSV